MQTLYLIAALWLALAVLSAIIAYHLHISIALVEICLGVVAAALAAPYGGAEALGANQEWLRFLASTGAVLLTFLAGAELDPDVVKTKWKEVSLVGLTGFFAPFLGCTALAYFVLDWSAQASWLAGIALATTSMAVIYSVMLETGFNRTAFGKGILAASFLNDFSSVVALGLIFAPFTYKTLVFIGIGLLSLALLPKSTAWLTRIYAHRTAAIRTKWVAFVLFGLGALAFWSGSEAVLPAYMAGIVLAGSAARDTFWVRRVRTLTVGFLTPFYFLRAGTLVSLPALLGAPLIFLLLLGGKILTKIFGLYPAVSVFRKQRNERWYYTLLMSTGLTFGVIAALYGLSNEIISQDQYSFLIAAVIASAVLPTLIAGFVFLPRHLLPSIAGVRATSNGDNGPNEEG